MEFNIDINKYILEKYVPAKVVEPTLELKYVDLQKETVELNDNNLHGQQKCDDLTFPFAKSALKSVPVKAIEVLVPGIEETQTIKRVLEFTVNVNDFGDIDYEPGDTIGILPSNPITQVQKLLFLLQLDNKYNQNCSLKISSTCTKKNVKLPAYIPSVTTPLEILRDCLNLQAVLKKQFLSAVAEYCSDIKEKSFLKCLSSKEGNYYYNELILEQRVTLLPILEICSSCKPTLELLIEHLPRLLPRPYSIANSPLTSRDNLKFIFSVLPGDKAGVTTSMLNEFTKEEMEPKILMYFRESNLFRYTSKELSSNQILIGVGTSVSPFLGFLAHKQCLISKTTNVKEEAGQTWLFVGAKRESTVLQRQHLLTHKNNHALNKYFEAFSRDPSATYHYVQEQIEANSSEFLRFFLLPDTVMYVCADGAKISKSIENAVANCLVKEMCVTEEEALRMLKDFRNKGKYREDLWL